MPDPHQPVHVRHSFRRHSPERVFDAWVDSVVARRWLFATPDGEIVRCDIHARVGGGFIITDRRGGDDVEHHGTYLEIDRPRRLVFTFSVPKFSSDVSQVTVEAAPSASGCELTLTNHDVPREWVGETERGWRDLLARLDEVLSD